jgi:hypothetical protein
MHWNPDIKLQNEDSPEQRHIEEPKRGLGAHRFVSAEPSLQTLGKRL